MVKVIIDGKLINNYDELFISLKEQIGSNEFYGNNFDALNDVVSSIYKEFEVTILNEELLIENLGNSYQLLLLVLNDLKNVNVIK